MNFLKKFQKCTKTVIASLLCICLLFAFATVAFAEEEPVITENMQKVIDAINTLPKDSTLLTIEHKDTILQIEKDYEALSDDEKIAFPLDTYNVFSAAQYGIMPILLNSVATGIEALPEKITAEHKEQVLAIQAEYLLLDEATQSALSEKYTKKLNDAVEKVNNPDAQDNKGEQKGEKTSVKIDFETVLILVLSLLVLVNLVLFIIVVVRLVIKKKERIEDEDDEIEE